MIPIIPMLSDEEFRKFINKDKNLDHNFNKLFNILISIQQYAKQHVEIEKLFIKQPYYIAKEIPKKLSCTDLDRFIRHINKAETHIKKEYISIQRNKCRFCEKLIDEKTSLFYHIFNLARLSFNGNIYSRDSINFKLAIPGLDIAGLCLLCSDCFRSSRVLFVLSNTVSMNLVRDPSNPLDPETTTFLILPNGQIAEKKVAADNIAMNRRWSIIHEMNLNRPHLVEQRKKAYQKTLEQIKYLKKPRQPTRLNKEIHEIFSTELPYTLARYSALEDIFGKTGAGVQSQDGSFQIVDFIRAYEYLEEVKCHPKLVENSWRPELLTWWHTQEQQNIQAAFNTLQKDFLRWLDTVQPQSNQPFHYPPLPMRPPRFIRKFSINNYRGLTIKPICLEPHPISDEADDSQQYAVPVPDAAFLADNAAGKTRLLQALVWALAGCEDVENLRQEVPDHYLPKGTTITIEFFDRPDKEQLVVKFPNDFLDTGQYTRRLGRENYSSRIPVLAFGSNRAPATEPDSRKNSPQKNKEYFIECAMTLFRRDRHVPHPLHYLPFDQFGWFKPSEDRSIDDELKIQAIRWLLVGLCPPKTKETDTAQVHFNPLKKEENKPRAELKLKEGSSQSEPISFENWSEGFQTTYTLALAVIFGMLAEDSGAPSGSGLQTTMSGIVLIDEFDAHLHPRWRLSILKQMKTVFPNVQCIFTTHDPVILRGMPTSNVFRLPAPENGKVTPINLNEATYLTGFEIDDLLISKLFKMDILRDEEDAEYYERYLYLLLKKAHADRAAGKPKEAEKHPKLSDEEKTELEFLRRRCGGGYAGLGHPRDQLILPVIDTIYAEYWDKEQKSSKKPSDTPADEQAKIESAQYIETVKKLLVEIWNR